MKISFHGERVLAVVAHPDDVELLCAGTLARAREDGARIGVCVMCQGDKGQPDPPLENLALVRTGELERATRLMGAELFMAGMPDSTLQGTDDTRTTLVELLRQFRPTLILGHAPNDYRADHRAASILVDACSWLATSRGWVTASPVLETVPAVWWMDTVGMHGFDPVLYIDVSQHMPLKEQMLLCHDSQLRRSHDTTFAPILDLLRLQSQTRGSQSDCKSAEAFRLHATFKRVRAC